MYDQGMMLMHLLRNNLKDSSKKYYVVFLNKTYSYRYIGAERIGFILRWGGRWMMRCVRHATTERERAEYGRQGEELKH